MIAHDYARSIVTNIAYGTGPYLRVTDLAIAVNDEMERRGIPRMRIIVPWVYADKQVRVMREEFSSHEEQYPGEIVLDPELGRLLKIVFYADSSYREALEQWVGRVKEVSSRAHAHLESSFSGIDLSGRTHRIEGKNIAMELSRSPRVRYDVGPAYFTSFAYIAEILEHARGVREIAVPFDLLEQGIVVANWVEAAQKVRCLAYPATFSYRADSDHVPRYAGEIMVPPIAPPPSEHHDSIAPGIFVTVTGIPGLERLYQDARRLGLCIYSNDTDAVPGSILASPHIIPNKNILFQFARAGWSSVWLSMISGTPLVVPHFDPEDDPEIYFNNTSVDALQLGLIYRGEPLEELLERRHIVQESCGRMKQEIMRRWGTLDGNKYSARLFVDDFFATSSTL